MQQVDIKIAQLQENIAAAPRHLRSIEEKLQQQKQAVDQADKAVPAEEGPAQKTGKRSQRIINKSSSSTASSQAV